MVPNTKEIAKILSAANRHPSKQLDINLRESEKPDAVDAFIVVKDSRPWILFSTLNNIGSDETGNTRLTVGAQYNNLWNRDHRFTGTYTTSPENARNVKQ
jgi:hemolysin activation/secretion protein